MKSYRSYLALANLDEQCAGYMRLRQPAGQQLLRQQAARRCRLRRAIERGLRNVL